MDRKIKVAVLGASSKPERYSNQAVKLLLEKGYEVIPVSPTGISVCNLETKKRLSEIKTSVDTLTIYVNPSISTEATDEILSLSPGRVIFNPGTENAELMKKCEEYNIIVEEACTLVLLRTNNF